jgi:hypothetical protein
MSSVLKPRPFETAAEYLLASNVTRPQEKLVVVEGVSDRDVFVSFVEAPWTVLAIGDMVKPRDGDGGARGRVIAFAKTAKDQNLENFTHAIVDRDFVKFDENLKNLKNLSFTDKRDLESTIASTKAFDRFLNIYIQKSSSTASSTQSLDILRKKVFHISSQLGRIRLLSSLEGWSLPFNKIEYSQVICTKRYRVKIFKIWQFLTKNLRPNDRFLKVSLKCLKQYIADTKGCDADFSRGHDLCGFLAAFPECPMNWDSITVERELRISFQKRDFLTTELGKRLLKRKIIT